MTSSPSIHPVCKAYWQAYLAQHDGQLPGRNAMIKALADAEITSWQVRRSWEQLAATHRARLVSSSPVLLSPEETQSMPDESTDLLHRMKALETAQSRLATQHSQDAALVRALMTSVSQLEDEVTGLTQRLEAALPVVEVVQQYLHALETNDDTWRPLHAVLRQDGIGGRNTGLRLVAQHVKRQLKFVE